MTGVKTSISWYSILVLMNMLHISKICDEYFKYEVTTDIQLVVPDVIEIPTFVTCFPIQLRETNTPMNYTQEEMISKVFSGKYTVKEMFDMTQDKSSFIINAYAFDVTVSETGRISYFFNYLGKIKDKYWTVFLMNERKCFAVRSPEERKYMNLRSLLNEGRSREVLIMTTEIDDDIDSAHLYAIRSGHYLSYGSISSALIRADDNKYIVSYETHEALLLESPYKTNCIKYSKGLTREECFESCMKKSSIDRLNLTHPLRTIYPDEEKNIFPISWLRKNIVTEKIPEGSLEFENKISRDCASKCSQRECDSVMHVPRVQGVSPMSEGVNGQINILVSDSPATKSVSQPAIPLITFLTNVFSTFGFWLGIAVSHLLPLSKKVFLFFDRWAFYREKKGQGATEEVKAVASKRDRSPTRKIIQYRKLTNMRPATC